MDPGPEPIIVRADDPLMHAIVRFIDRAEAEIAAAEAAQADDAA